MTIETDIARGGVWLTSGATEAFTPEQLSDDHRMIAQTVREFMTQEVLPAIGRLEQKDWTLARSLIAKAGELGLIGTDVPEDLGGIGLDKTASLIIGEAVGDSASFATTFGAQTGLSIIPLLCFGTEAQQRAYLPRLASGEILGAYALSESGSGSDALSARARATRQADGSFRLSGEKMWITNGGFADLFIVFAQIDGNAFSAFIVEREFGGVSNGKEEHKLGLHGSSTTPLILEDVPVPAANLLGEAGKGHKVALNTLNYGRFKLAAMCSGGAKAALADAASYAATRKQFDTPIAEFGAIQHKVGEMTARLYGVESALYRMSGLLDRAIAGGMSLPAALEEFAIEASLLKVAGSEMIDFIVDENVQIHGGNGFVTDYPAERRYRDARVNRIFEGTNEINRLLVPGMLARRARKDALPIVAAYRALQQELLGEPAAPPADESRLAPETALVEGMRKTALALLGTAMHTHGDSLAGQQEILTFISDALADLFVAESALLRAQQAARDDARRAPLHEAAARVVVRGAVPRMVAAATEAAGAMLNGDTQRQLLTAVQRWLTAAPADLVTDRRALAAKTVAEKRYVFEIRLSR